MSPHQPIQTFAPLGCISQAESASSLIRFMEQQGDKYDKRRKTVSCMEDLGLSREDVVRMTWEARPMAARKEALGVVTEPVAYRNENWYNGRGRSA